VALWNWMDETGVGRCPAGQVWSVKHGGCIDKRYESDPNAGVWGNTVEALQNTGAELRDWSGRCQSGFTWDASLQECVPVSRTAGNIFPNIGEREDPSGTGSGGINTTLETGGGGGGLVNDGCPEGQIRDALGNCMPDPFGEPEVRDNIIPDEDIIGDTPTGLYDNDEIISSLSGWLTADQSQATEDAYWDTKMRRLDEQYEKAKAQKMEEMNVKGLYYSGARDTAMEDLEEEYFQVVAEEESKFQHERFTRDVQRYTMAMQYTLGAKAQEIQWSLGRGQLTLQQLNLALEEALGFGALELQEKGLLMDYMKGMYYIGIAQDTNEMNRQQMWINTVALLHQMGVTDEQINEMWASISGAPSTPPV